MDSLTQAIAIAFGSFLAGSGGFWVYLTHKYKSRDDISKLIMGLAHDKIVYLGMKYIAKGFVTQDEYEDLIKYFCEPYISLGGNGSVDRIMRMVKMLPLKPERREFPEMREAIDSLAEGADAVIERIKEGENDFGRNK